MPRLTISLTDEQYNKIKILAENKSMSLSYYGSTLLDMGLRVEQAISEVHQPTAANMNLITAEYILKTLLTWELESRYLMRYLIKNDHSESSQQRNAFLREAKEKAALRIDERFGYLFSTQQTT